MWDIIRPAIYGVAIVSAFILGMKLGFSFGVSETKKSLRSNCLSDRLEIVGIEVMDRCYITQRVDNEGTLFFSIDGRGCDVHVNPPKLILPAGTRWVKIKKSKKCEKKDQSKGT